MAQLRITYLDSNEGNLTHTVINTPGPFPTASRRIMRYGFVVNNTGLSPIITPGAILEITDWDRPQASVDPQPPEKSPAVHLVPTEQIEEVLKIEMARYPQRSPDSSGKSTMDLAREFKRLLEEGVPKIRIREMYPRAGGRKGVKEAPASNSFINIYVSFLNFPEAIQEKIDDGRLTVKGAYELSKSTPEMWAAVLKRAEADCFAKGKKSVGDKDIKEAAYHYQYGNRDPE